MTDVEMSIWNTYIEVVENVEVLTPNAVSDKSLVPTHNTYVLSLSEFVQLYQHNRTLGNKNPVLCFWFFWQLQDFYPV